MLAAVCGLAQGTAAQDSAAVLTARIVDGTGRPVPDADVFVVQLDRTVRSGLNGVFRLSPVPAGRYTVGVRKLGHLPTNATIFAAVDAVPADIELVVITTRIAPVVTTARRGGLSGVVSDTGLRPLARAQVKPAGSGRSVRTDAAGRFFIDLRPGTYMVSVVRDSFARQTLAVTIPKDSGREIAVWLSPRDRVRRAEEIMQEVRIFDLDQRMIRTSRQSSHYYSRDQLIALDINDMLRLANRWANGSITAECTIAVVSEGGAPYKVPLNSVRTDDVEFVELYMRGAQSRQGQRGVSINGNPTRYAAMIEGAVGTSPYCGNLSINVWLRR